MCGLITCLLIDYPFVKNNNICNKVINVQPQKTWSLDLHMLVVHFLAQSPRLWGKNVILNKTKIAKKKFNNDKN